MGIVLSGVGCMMKKKSNKLYVLPLHLYNVNDEYIAVGTKVMSAAAESLFKDITKVGEYRLFIQQAGKIRKVWVVEKDERVIL